MPLLTVHFHEVALKGGNRPRFQRQLRTNLERALRRHGPCTVRNVASRFLVDTEAGEEAALAEAAEVCGVAYAMPVRRLPRDLDEVAAAVVAEVRRREGLPHFRITTRRVDKSFPRISLEVDREVGRIVHEATGTPVRLKGAALEAYVVVLEREILLGFEKRPGSGGLPVGTGGRVAVLLSGGIDSPVAAWQMIHRGCRADLVHFHSHPLVDRTTQEKARDLAEALARYQFDVRLHLVPLAAIQTEIRLHTPERLRVVLYRRFMVRIAERIARVRRCRALVTGESLGQVASQTLENLATVDAAATMPVLRPLVGTDKQDIIRRAERIGTYGISIRPDQDCCQLFVPPRPATKTTPEEAAAAEEALAVDELVEDAVARTEATDVSR